MKQLAKEIEGRGEVKGYSFRRIRENEYAYVYEVSSDGSKSKHYEIFERKINTYFDCESYPSSKAFGIWAFTVNSLEKADIKFNEISKRVKNRIENNLNKQDDEISNG